MKKTYKLFALAALLFANPFKEANATCGLVPTITVQPGTHCVGDIITILGVNRATGSLPFTMELQTTDGTNYFPIASITQSNRSCVFFHTITTADGAVLALKVKVVGDVASDCQFPKLSVADYEYVDLSITAWNVTVAGNVCSGPSYNLTLEATDGSAVTYYAYKNGVFLSSLLGDDMGTPPDFGPVSAVGAYTIVANSNSTSCKTNQIGTLNIIETPAIPTYTYTWCGAGFLTLTGISTTAGVTYTLKDLTSPTATYTGTAAVVISPASSIPGNSWSLTASLAGCTSSVATPTFAQKFIPTPVIQYLTYDNDCPGPCGLGSYTITFPGTAQINLHEDAGSPTTNFWNMTSNAGAAGTTYQWLISGSPLTGYTSQTFPTQPKINNAGGQFQIKQTNVCGSITSNQVYVTFSPAGIGRKGLLEDDATSSLIYPNPTSGELNINSPYDNYTLSVTNLLGSEVLSKQVNQNSTSVDLSSLSIGSYVVKMIGAEGTVTKKVQVVK